MNLNTMTEVYNLFGVERARPKCFYDTPEGKMVWFSKGMLLPEHFRSILNNDKYEQVAKFEWQMQDAFVFIYKG